MGDDHAVGVASSPPNCGSSSATGFFSAIARLLLIGRSTLHRRRYVLIEPELREQDNAYGQDASEDTRRADRHLDEFSEPHHLIIKPSRSPVVCTDAHLTAEQPQPLLGLRLLSCQVSVGANYG